MSARAPVAASRPRPTVYEGAEPQLWPVRVPARTLSGPIIAGIPIPSRPPAGAVSEPDRRFARDLGTSRHACPSRTRAVLNPSYEFRHSSSRLQHSSYRFRHSSYGFNPSYGFLHSLYAWGQSFLTRIGRILTCTRIPIRVGIPYTKGASRYV